MYIAAGGLGLRGKSRVVVVLNESSEKSGVGAGGLHGVDHTVEVADTSRGRLERIEEGVVAAEDLS